LLRGMSMRRGLLIDVAVVAAPVAAGRQPDAAFARSQFHPATAVWIP